MWRPFSGQCPRNFSFLGNFSVELLYNKHCWICWTKNQVGCGEINLFVTSISRGWLLLFGNVFYNKLSASVLLAMMLILVHLPVLFHTNHLFKDLVSLSRKHSYKLLRLFYWNRKGTFWEPMATKLAEKGNLNPSLYNLH